MRIDIRLMCVMIALGGSLIAAACTGGVEPREIPTPKPPLPTPAPRNLSLPDDDAAHDAPIEWWYYNGHLRADDGSEYSFHFVVFQTQSSGGETQFEYGQTGITDANRGNHTYIGSDAFGSGETINNNTGTEVLSLDLGNFTLDIQSDGSHSFAATDRSSSNGIQLRTEPSAEIMLHEGNGWMDWPFGWTYYYSYPRMKAEGRLVLAGENIDVSGEVWFDHQWGDFFVVGKPAGWQWFAVHLNDGRSLMVSEVRGSDGQIIAVDGTLVGGGTEHRVLDHVRDGITLEVLAHWTSPNTGGEYPARWRLKIDSEDLDVVLSPSLADQEVPALPYGNQAAAYWEGRVEVLDSETLEPVGLAFAELSGYVEPEPLTWRTENE